MEAAETAIAIANANDIGLIRNDTRYESHLRINDSVTVAADEAIPFALMRLAVSRFPRQGRHSGVN
jgi:hypothetical protein